MRKKSANDPDLAVARLADDRHGIVKTSHLLGAGVSEAGIHRRVKAGRLHPIHRGVYAVGHTALSSEGRWLAAVYALGDGAVLSHLAAASLWRFLDWGDDWPVDVTIPTSSGRKNCQGIRIHRSLSLDARCSTRRSNIPVTTVRRTLLDLPRVATPAQVREAIRAAEKEGWRSALPHGPLRTRSELEELFLSLCRRYRLPLPEVNVKVGSFVADFLWPQHRVIVETDGWKYHRGRATFESDHERHLALQRMGYEVIRLTYRQITENPRSVAASVRTVLRRRTVRGPP